MAPPHNAAKVEREKKLKTLLAFASRLADRIISPGDATLVDDLQLQICTLPLQPSSAAATKQDELDRQGTELWNLSTRLRREESQQIGKSKEDATRKSRALCLLRVFAFLLLDSAGGQSNKGRERKNSVRLLKVALKAARFCIESNELSYATKVLERAADYQDVVCKEHGDAEDEQVGLGYRLRLEYLVLRTTLAWRQDRMDTAEHMFTKCKQLKASAPPSSAETLADLLYEIGKDLLRKRNYELAVRWLERAYDVLGEQDIEMLSPEAGELRLSVMQSIVQAYMKLKSSDAVAQAWHVMQLLEADYSEKMTVSLLKLELLSAADSIDTDQFYTVLHRMIRSVVLNDKNFKTVLHYIHKLKDHSNFTACKLIDELIETRLFAEENEAWMEKALITRVWICCTSSIAEDVLDQLQELFDNIVRSTKSSLSSQATHAAQTLLWKRVEAAYVQEQYLNAEAWCRICLHALFEKAGDMNKSKIARKMMLCALARRDYAMAKEVYSHMSDTGRDDRMTRYIMYKTALHSGDFDMVAECLDIICRQSTKDATLLYACVLEAKTSGNKRQAISALEKVIEKCNHSTPADIHLPALLRTTARLLQGELVHDGTLRQDIMNELCVVFEGACAQAKASRRRPSNPARNQFTSAEFVWFSKNAYNLCIKYCAEMQPTTLIKLLDVCIEFIRLLKEADETAQDNDLSLRLLFCHFLAVCAFVTLARAEDTIQDCLQHYLQVRKHGQAFRDNATATIHQLGESAKADVVAKHFQVIKLELEAALKLEQWDELDDLFDQCWKYESPDHYETLADLVLVIQSCMVKANVAGKYQEKLFSVLQKIINMTWRQTGNDIVKLSRWIRCLFQLALTYDENISLKCLDHATQIAAARQGAPPRVGPLSTLNTPPPSSCLVKVSDVDVTKADFEDKEPNHYPETELEWLATTTFNHAVDYYVQEDDAKCKLWAEKAVSLSQWAEDGGELKSLLMEKYSGLTWQDDE